MGLEKSTYDIHSQPMLSHINVGTGDDVTIRQLATVISKTVGYMGEVQFDPSKPDGTPRKLMDSSRLNALGWKANVELEMGLEVTYQDFLKTTVRTNK